MLFVFSFSSANESGGWCEQLSFERVYIKHDNIKTKDECEKQQSNTGNYQWQTAAPKESLSGHCRLGASNPSNPNFKGYYDTTQRGCENHNANSNEKHHWISDKYPMVYLGENKTGFGVEIKHSISNLNINEKRIDGLIKSYHVQKNTGLSFCTEINFQGDCFDRHLNDGFDEGLLTEGGRIKSIKILDSTNLPVEIKHEIKSVNQVYFGERNPNLMCSENGRLLSQADIDKINGRTNICNFVTSPWAIWKIKGSDGSDWSFMGKGYNCEIKSGVDSWAQPLCVMNSTTKPNQAFLFTDPSFMGIQSWQGQATVKYENETVNQSHIQSFLLGANVSLEAYSENDFKGSMKVYLSSQETASFIIKSYKVIAQD